MGVEVNEWESEGEQVNDWEEASEWMREWVHVQYVYICVCKLCVCGGGVEGEREREQKDGCRRKWMGALIYLSICLYRHKNTSFCIVFVLFMLTFSEKLHLGWKPLATYQDHDLRINKTKSLFLTSSISRKLCERHSHLVWFVCDSWFKSSWSVRICLRDSKHIVREKHIQIKYTR